MNTDGHLTPEERLAYWQRSLAPGDLLAASDHLEQCEICRTELLRARPARFDSEPVSFEELAAAASGELDPLAQRRINRSPRSAAELEDLEHFRDEMNDLPPHDYSLGEMATASRTSWILPIAAGLALGFAFLWWNTSERNATRGLVLRDAGEQMVIRQNGEVPAVGPLPEELQSAVRAATSLGKAPLPRFSRSYGRRLAPWREVETLPVTSRPSRQSARSSRPRSRFSAGPAYRARPVTGSIWCAGAVARSSPVRR